MNYDYLISLCFTGHRPEKLGFGFEGERAAALKLKLREQVMLAIADGFLIFYSGGARGVDTFAAYEVLAARERYKNIKLHMALPCPEQSMRWDEDDRARFREITARADYLSVICPTYTPYCMAERNRFMVERCSRVAAVWDGAERGGTWQTVKMARSRGAEVVCLEY